MTKQKCLNSNVEFFLFAACRDWASILLGKAIEFLYSIKLIHTDLKPENIVLTSCDKREVKLDSGDVIRVPAAPHIKGDQTCVFVCVLYINASGLNRTQ